MFPSWRDFFYMSVSKDKVRINSLLFQFSSRQSRVMLLWVCALPSVYKANWHRAAQCKGSVVEDTDYF